MNIQTLSIIASVMLPLVSLSGEAGILDDFEKDSTTPRESRSSSSNRGPGCYSSICANKRKSIGDELGDSFFDAMFKSMINGTIELFSYGTRVTLDRSSWYQRVPGISQRKEGSPLLSSFRVSGTWQSVYPDLGGRDFSIEVGQSLFSAQFRRTKYIESTPSDELSLTYGLVFYRLSYGNNFEWNLGIGRGELSGNERTSGGTFSSPILWQFSEHFAFSLWQSFTSFPCVSTYYHTDEV